MAVTLVALAAGVANPVMHLESLVTDLETDLMQFDEAEEWMSRTETAAATVLALYDGSPPNRDAADLVAAVETAGWQMLPSITRNTIDDLRSTGNYRLIRDRALRGAITDYYTGIENAIVPLAAMQDRIWNQYDAQVGHVLEPGVRLAVLQRPGSFAEGITSDALGPAEPPHLEQLIAALKNFPELRIAAGDALYQTISNRGTMEEMRTAAKTLKAELERWLAAHRYLILIGEAFEARNKPAASRADSVSCKIPQPYYGMACLRAHLVMGGVSSPDHRSPA